MQSLPELGFNGLYDKINVPHRRLMGELQSYGAKGRILTWIKSFLTGRTQVVKVAKWFGIRISACPEWHTPGKCPRSVTFRDLHQ